MRLSFLCIAIAPAFLLAQSNLGSIDGKVIDSVTGEAVKKAVVTIRNGTGQYSYFTVADASGKFHVDSVQPEKYTAASDAEGYSSNLGAGLKPFTVSAAQELTGIELRLAPLGVISGKVVDDDGEPLDSVTVWALRYLYNGGVKNLQQVTSGQTDDRGQYRLFDLQPGRYYLSASMRRQPVLAPQPPGGHMHSTVPEEGYAAVIYPGAADVSQASAHQLKPGEDWAGADFKLRKLPAYHIRGRIDGPAHAGGSRGNVQAESCNPDPIPNSFLPNAAPRLDGSFDLAGAVSGAYCLQLREPGRDGIALTQTVTIKDADLNDVTLTPPAAFSLKGNIVIDGTPPQHMLNIGIGLRSSDGNQQIRALVASDLTFQIDNLFPGNHTIVLPGANQLYAKSILYEGQDVSSGVIPDVEPGASLSIVMGTDPGEIDGTVQLGSLEPGTPVLIATIPDDAHAARNDLFRITSSAAEGAFSLRGLAPGDYKLLALQGQNFEDVQNRDLLKLLEDKATAVTVHAAGHEQASLTPVSAGEIGHAKEKLP